MSLAQLQRLSLARELHDSVVQEFLVIVMQLRRIEETAVRSDVAERIDFGLQAADRGIDRVRRLVKDLRSSEVAQSSTGRVSSLGEEVGWTLDAVLAHASLRKMVRCPDALYLPAPIQGEVVNVVREAATNAVRHAAARCVECTIVARHRTLEVTVRDDGCGFPCDLNEAADDIGYGLIGMRERADLIGATITIGPNRRGGTSVGLTLPIDRSLRSHIASSRHRAQADPSISS